MIFTEAIKVCFTKYAEFRGCARRSEFWWWVLFTSIAYIALRQISDGINTAFSIATLLPSFAVGARRLHDTDRTGWWQLLYLIPIIGRIILIIFCAETGKANRYGDEASDEPQARDNPF